MKLLVQGDDYGFTKGVTLGMLEGIDHGVLTCSGLFVNMPDAEWAAAQMLSLIHILTEFAIRKKDIDPFSAVIFLISY